MTQQARIRRGTAAAIVLLLCASATLLFASTSRAATSQASRTFSASETITRDNLVAGKNQVVDRRKVSLHVSETQDLRGRQEVSVTWSGAHPTGGIVANQNSIDAQEEEYPFVLLECRGVDSSNVKASERLSQKTCWTQSWSERYQDSFQYQFPPYRLDRYASKAERGPLFGAPKKETTACQLAGGFVQHWVPFVAASGHIYYGGSAGCQGQPPESQNVGNSALPSNETFGVTGTDGRGSAKFDIWTSEENKSLGCTQTVKCSLVAVPIMGISCDATAKGLPSDDRPPSSERAADQTLCEQKGEYKAGQLASPGGNSDLAVSGSLWWSASNWRNRITVPLSFAVPANACDVVSSSHTVLIYGSQLLSQATGQWAPHFCLSKKLFKFTHVQDGEPQARNLVETGGAPAAFTSEPQAGGYGKPVVNAPVALSGFAITYAIDGANGQPYTKLRLTPRLLAKLLTESYPSELAIKDEDTALSNNPLNITLDPEFQQLNPGITKGVAASEAASALLTLSGQSDVTEALTTYINDDPTARAWLNGKPDPWGMVVNPDYKNIKLPIDTWPLRSTFEPKKYYASDLNDCLHNNPVPFLPLVAAPMASLEDISEAMQFSLAASTTTCSQIDGTTVGEKLVPQGRQTTGFRFVIGLSSIADADRYQLETARLQTINSHTFVGPTNAALRTAGSFLKPDKKTGSWPVPYKILLTSAKAANAYPGTMLVYAAVPTTGLASADAHDLATLLRYTATSGQRQGLKVGEIPPGFLPLTKANGLSALSNYTYAAAANVEAQNGKLPPMTGNPAPAPIVSSSTKTANPDPQDTSSSTPPAGGDQSASTDPTPTDSVSTPPSGSPAPSTGATPGPEVAVALGRTLGINLGGGGLAILVVTAVALVCLVAAPTTYVVGRKRGKW